MVEGLVLLWRGPRSAKTPSTSNDAEKPCSADSRCWGLRSAGLLQTKLLQQVHCACWSRGVQQCRLVLLGLPLRVPAGHSFGGSVLCCQAASVNSMHMRTAKLMHFCQLAELGSSFQKTSSCGLVQSDQSSL